MSQDNNESRYHGYLYFSDTKNSRQYAVRYDNGEPQLPVIVAADPTEGKFTANETVFAFDDEIERTKTADGKVLFSVYALQIDIGPNGEPQGGNDIPVQYELSFAVDPGKGSIDVTYKLTEESRKSLATEKFSKDFPTEFKQELSVRDPGVKIDSQGRLAVTEALLGLLYIPPHHDGGALLARKYVVDISSNSNGQSVEDRPQQNTPGKVAPAFNTSRNPSAIASTQKKFKITDAALEALIKQYCKDWSELAAQGNLDPVIGRDEDTKKAIMVMSRRSNSGACFIGEAGVGKSAMFRALAHAIAEGKDIPDDMQGGRVLQLNLQDMNAGAKFRGDFEAKLLPLMNGLSERGGYFKGRKIILGIDEMHSQMTAGMASGGTDAGNMMKPFLAAEGFSIFGTTTLEEYRKHIEKDPALSRRFEPIILDPPSSAQTLEIAKGLWPILRDFHGMTEDLTEEDLEYIVTMTDRYAPNEAQPSKTAKVLDSAGAIAKVRHSTVIERDDILQAVAQMSGLDVSFLNQSDHDRFLRMEEDLPKKVLDQDSAIRQVVDGIVAARSGLTDPKRPWACFLLQGPTGTGKTELAKKIAEHLFGDSDKSLIKLDMSEYMERHTVSRLIGAPPGYVGFEDAEPALTEKIKRKPYCVLLLDEVEKAHADVFNVLLSILNDGKMTDNKGKTVLFNNVIILMTSNLGAEDAMKLLYGEGGMSFGGIGKAQTPQEVEAQLDDLYKKARNKKFKPEMINRINSLGGPVNFKPLSAKTIRTLVDWEVRNIGKRLSAQDGANIPGLSLTVSDEVKNVLGKKGFDPAMGARPLQGVVLASIQGPLGYWVMKNKDALREYTAKHGPTEIRITSLENIRNMDMKDVLHPATQSNDNKKRLAFPAAKKPKPKMAS